MSTNDCHDRRGDFRGCAVLCVIAILSSPLLLAQTIGTGAWAGPLLDRTGPGSTEICDSAFPPPSRASLSESGGTAGFASAAFPFGRVSSAGLAFVNRKSERAAQSPDDAQAAPPDSAGQPSLKDLGFAPEQARGSAEAQARLDKRSQMLKIHQRLGLMTLVPMLATIITSGGAGGKHGSASGRDLHGALGVVTAGMYFTSAAYAVRAPKVPGTEVRGPIRWHKALAWVHGVGMILTPILGAMARAQLNRGERVHGIAAAHSAVADVTYAAYGAAIGSVAIKF